MINFLKKSSGPSLSCFLLIFFCFLLTSCGYLSWLYHLMEIMPDPQAADLSTEVCGYLFQAAGIGCFAACIHNRPGLRNHNNFIAVVILYVILLIPSVLSGEIIFSLIAGFFMNLLCGFMSGYYLYSLTSIASRQQRATVFGLAYGLSSIFLWLLTLTGDFLNTNYSLIPVALLAIVTASLCKTVTLPLGETSSDTNATPTNSTSSDTISDTLSSEVRRDTFVLAAATVILLSLVKNLGFVFPSADIGAGISLELSRTFYGAGLMLAGFVSDRDRKYGAVFCLAALVIPFIMLALSGEPLPGILLWSLNYFFFGFFSVFRVILFSDMAEHNGLLWASGFGLLFGRLGDAAGTSIYLLLNQNISLLVIIAATLFILTVFLFFQLYQQIYISPLKQMEAAPRKTDQEHFEEFCVSYKCSQREREVLRLILKEHSNSEIAELLFISESTVKFHIHNLLKKTECRNRMDLLGLYHSKR